MSVASNIEEKHKRLLELKPGTRYKMLKDKIRIKGSLVQKSEFVPTNISEKRVLRLSERMSDVIVIKLFSGIRCGFFF